MAKAAKKKVAKAPAPKQPEAPKRDPQDIEREHRDLRRANFGF